jgi:hypothetical protein
LFAKNTDGLVGITTPFNSNRLYSGNVIGFDTPLFYTGPLTISFLENSLQKERGGIVKFFHVCHVVHDEVKILLTDLINLCFGVRLGDISGDEPMARFWDAAIAIGVRGLVILDYACLNIRWQDT